MKPLLVTSGEPAGIGPDLCLALAAYHLPVVILGDKALLAERAMALNLKIHFVDYHAEANFSPNSLCIYPVACSAPVVAGQLDVRNANYVLKMLELGCDQCLAGEFSALITAPVNKEVINQAGIGFTGHTEFLATRCQAEQVVMLLASDALKVALVTTHLPLRDVASSITESLIMTVIVQLHRSLKHDFAMPHPRIFVAGLNPHAGEGGYLGDEEVKIIAPALAKLRKQGIDVRGPFSADTLFFGKNAADCDVFVAMYHDQGLPVLKYASFGEAVNVTLGLPIIRTSVDHGTALELAGKGLAKEDSLLAAIKMAAHMVQGRTA